jgi:hypothetical protein
MTGSSTREREPLPRRLLRIVVLLTLYGAGYSVLDFMTRAVPEVRTVLLVLGILSIPILVWMVWKRDYDQPPRREI